MASQQPQRSASMAGQRGREKTYFEQQREILIGDIAVVSEKWRFGHQP